MNIPEIQYADIYTLSIDQFRKMDYLAVEKYKISIELMMENAGLHLAHLVAGIKPGGGNISIGTGTGNNGGGGLVAARRLAGWGYNVYLDIPDKNLRELPGLQLERALACGAIVEHTTSPDVFIDAYLGFSQRLPLPQKFSVVLSNVNSLNCTKISLDLPTGFNKSTGSSEFVPDCILTLAAMKTELKKSMADVDIYIADLGLPASIYWEFGIKQPNGFSKSGIVAVNLT